MNIYLIPYTGMRHAVMGLMLAAVGLMSWWCTMFMAITVAPWLHANVGVVWSRSADGMLYVGTLVIAVAFCSLLGEGALKRRALLWRVLWATLAGGVAFGLLAMGWGLVTLFTPLFTGTDGDALLADPSLVTLRYRLAVWLVAGLSAGTGPFLARALHRAITTRFSWGGHDRGTEGDVFSWLDTALSASAHLGGGLVAGASAAVAWHVPGYYDALAGDLYLASALAAFVFGFFHGLLVWPIPDGLYAGWVRVLSYERYGLRIPIPQVGGGAAERFVGHFPRGLDLYLPVERGVTELHVSFVRSADRYTVRGLTIAPTLVKRWLERIDLRYDPNRPAPLETTLRMEDRVLLGEKGEAEVEFLMLPREER